MTEDLEERIRRLEELMMSVLEKLERIESVMDYSGLGSQDTVFRLVMGYSLPIVEALEAARRLVAIGDRVSGLDEISIAILEAVSDCGGYSISEITRRVRRIRGRASRRIISQRVKELEDRGLLKNIGSENRPKYVLSTCLQ